MSGSLQQAIDLANRKSDGARKRTFAKKATDVQFLNGLCKHVDVAMEVYRSIPALMDDHRFRSAMRELESFTTMTKKHLQP